MKFGVVVCPHCRQAKGVDLSCKTTRCPRCGKLLTIEQLKVFYKTNSKERLRRAIGLVNAQVEGRLKEFKKRVRQP